MEGQVVSIGSSISTTGNMLVTCNKPYVLKVNDVVWSPVEDLGTSQRYILSTGGFVEILVDDERIFFFRNYISPDFAFTNNQLLFKAGGQQGEERGSYLVNGIYHQRRFPSSDVDYALVTIYPRGGTTVIDGLDLVANQGDVTIGSSTSAYQSFLIRNIDASQYLSVKLGNVLLDFILPFEE